jgi:hypothetical protein
MNFNIFKKDDVEEETFEAAEFCDPEKPKDFCHF